MFVFGLNSKGFKEFKSGISFIGVIFFFHVFSVFLSFAPFFLVAAHKKDSFRLRIHENISAHIDVIKICST